MRPRTPSPPLITGIDGIVSRPPNEVNYSTLNGKRMETGKQPENKIRRKHKKYGLKQMEKNYMRKGKYTGKINKRMEPGDDNKIETLEKDVGCRIEYRRGW